MSAPAATNVSVVIPCFNAGHTLAAALASVEAQTRAALEVLVVDDGSSPEHARLTEEIAGRFPMARYISLALNAGPAGARNRGTREARGTFVAFLDADDTWLPHKLERCVDLMEERGLDFLGHNTTIAGRELLTINDRLRPHVSLYPMRPFDIAVATSQFSPSTVIFRKAGMPVTFDELLRRSEDYRLWGDLVFQGRALWKSKEFLSARDQPHMKASGLSSDHDALLAAHLASIDHFRNAGFISEASRRFMRFFLRARFRRHRR